MRWKLLIITSLVAALLSAGGIRALAYWTESFMRPLSEQPLPLLTGFILVPLALTTLACVFVYRHTARRRKLQVALTASLSIILTVAALFIIAQIFPRNLSESGLFPSQPPRSST